MPNATRARWVAPAVWATFIEVVTSWPNPRQFGSLGTNSDKAGHLILYGILGYLVYRAFEHASPRGTALALTILVCAIWGALDEWHQLLIPGRSADVPDWIADALGGVIGAATRAFVPRPPLADRA